MTDPVIMTHPAYFKVITPTMTLSREAIALELSVGSVQNALNFLPDFFKNVSGGIVGLFSRQTDFWRAKHLSIQGDKIIKKFSAENYYTVVDAKFTALEGFDGTFLEYMQLLHQSFNYYEEKTFQSITSLRFILSDLITNANAQLKLDNKFNLKQIEKDIENYDEAVKNLFAKGSHKAETTVGAVVPQYAQLSPLYKSTNDLISTMKVMDPQALSKRVTEVNELIDAVIKLIEEGKFGKITTAQINNLTDGVYAVAKQVEFFGITYYRAATLVAAVDRFTEVLSKH